MNRIDRYAVIGHGIAHSRSPEIHALFARATHQALEYGLIDVAPVALEATVRSFFAGGGRGLNVTVPHKQAVLPLCARLTPRAARAAAVNTLALQEDGSLLGDNTDGAGLVRDLAVNLGFELRGARVLLLGAGGAARGVLAPLLAAGVAAVVIANRNAQKAEVLSAEFADLGAVSAMRTGDATAAATPCDLLLNATAASQHGAVPDIPTSSIATRTLCYDLAYGPATAGFLAWAHGAGAARAVTGIGMLVEQAAESFLLWRGVRPDTAPVLAAFGAAAR